MQRQREIAQLVECALGSGCDLGGVGADPPRLATEVPLIGPSEVGAVLLEKMPLVADHRIESFDVLGKLGNNSCEVAGGVEAKPGVRVFMAVPDAAHSVDAALSARSP